MPLRGQALLHGRDDTLAALRRLFARLRSGSGGTVLVEGLPGMGKSRLIEHALSAARETGFAIAHGTAEPRAASLPMSALIEALFGGPAPLFDRSALPDWRASTEQRYQLLQDLQELLEKAALRHPILICLDDLQWADSGTREAIQTLPARLASLPIGWILAYRPTDPDSDLRRVVTSLMRDGADVTVLAPLPADAVAQVAADILGAVPHESVLSLAEGAGGNPFYLIELLSGLRDEDLFAVQGGRAVMVSTRLPLRVRDSMRRRLGRMSPDARAVAAVAAALGRRFTAEQIAAVLGQPVPALLPPIAELVGERLVTEDAASSRDGTALRFTHDLNREAVRASQPSSAMAALDRLAASTLLASGALPAEVALQLAASAEPGDETAVVTLMRAGDTLGGTDPGMAADLVRRALDLAPEGHRLRGPLAAQATVLLHAAGRIEEAVAFADTALHQSLPADQEAEVRLSIAGFFSLSPELRAASCRHGLALDGIPDHLRARLEALLFHNLVVAGHPGDAARMLDDAWQSVERTGDDTARFNLTLGEATLRYAQGRYESALDLVETALRSPGSTDDPRWWLARSFRGRILTVVGRFDEALAWTTEAIAASQRARQGRVLQVLEGNRARQYFQRGLLADAAAALEGRFCPEDAHRVVDVLEADAVVVLGRVSLHTANQQQVELTAAVAREMLRSGVPAVQRHAAWLLALQAHAAGDPGQARRWLAALGEAERLSLFPLYLIDPADNPQLVRIALASDDRELARSVTADALRRAAANTESPAMQASAAHASGLLTGDTAELRRAVSILETTPLKLALASALEDLAVRERGTTRTEETIAVLDRALAIYVGCDASWDAARVRRRLRRLGVTRRAVAARRPGTGWAALTESELAVVRLVAYGLTNREVADRLRVSPHTVNGHLRHSFDKLGVNSRVALSQVVNRNDKSS